jgi:rhodanese-related sulfurtransferase
MRRIALLVAVSTFAAGLLAGCGAGTDLGLLPAEVEEITAAELQRMVDRGENITIIDVRSAAEYDSGHIPGSINIPVAELPGRMDTLNDDRPVACVCASGQRSGQAAQMLALAGFSRVYNVEDGVNGWPGELE